MARLVEIDTEDILCATRAVLIEKGAKATASDVARKANISEGSIFSRFKTKSELFKQAIFSVLTKEWFMALDEYDESDDFQEILAESLVQSLRCLRIVMPMHMLAITLCGGKDEVIDYFRSKNSAPAPSRIHKKFEAYINVLITKKHVGECDVDSVCSMLVGGLVHRVFMERVGTLEKPSKNEDLELSRVAVQTIMHGIHKK